MVTDSIISEKQREEVEKLGGISLLNPEVIAKKLIENILINGDAGVHAKLKDSSPWGLDVYDHLIQDPNVKVPDYYKTL